VEINLSQVVAQVFAVPAGRGLHLGDNVSLLLCNA